MARSTPDSEIVYRKKLRAVFFISTPQSTRSFPLPNFPQRNKWLAPDPDPDLALVQRAPRVFTCNQSSRNQSAPSRPKGPSHLDVAPALVALPSKVSFDFFFLLKMTQSIRSLYRKVSVDLHSVCDISRLG